MLGRGRATPRTAARPRTSSRTPRGPGGRRWRSPPRPSPADLRRPADADVRPVEREHLRRVRRVDEEERSPVGDVVAVELCRLVPVRGTARRREAARRSRCRRALRPMLRRARPDGRQGPRCAVHARAAGPCRGRSRATARRPPLPHGSAARPTAALLQSLRDRPPPPGHPTLRLVCDPPARLRGVGSVVPLGLRRRVAAAATLADRGRPARPPGVAPPGAAPAMPAGDPPVRARDRCSSARSPRRAS